MAQKTTSTKAYLDSADDLFNQSAHPPPPAYQEHSPTGFPMPEPYTPAPENTSYFQQAASSSSSSPASSNKGSLGRRPGVSTVGPSSYAMQHAASTDTYQAGVFKEEHDIAAPLEPLPSYAEANRPTSLPTGPNIQHTVIHGPHAVVSSAEGAIRSGQLWCATCRTTVIPIVKRRPGLVAFFWAILLLIFFWPLFWLPLVVPACHEKCYRCPYCSNTILTSHD